MKPVVNKDAKRFVEEYQREHLILLDIFLACVLFLFAWIFIVFILV